MTGVLVYDSDSGTVFVTGPCYGCGNLFSFHPNKVPSITPPGGDTPLPVCLSCVERVNPARVKNGLPEIVPLPGAYEPAAEEEINWGDD